MVLKANRFFLSGLIANMATILINFQQKFALVRNLQHFVIKFFNQKRFLARLKSALRSLLNWRGITQVVPHNRSKQLSERE